jgi:hypothetical protein
MPPQWWFGFTRQFGTNKGFISAFVRSPGIDDRVVVARFFKLIWP